MGIKEDFEKWFADRFKGALDFNEEAEDGDAVAAISRIVGLEAFEAGQVALAGRIAELEAERDALRADAERYEAACFDAILALAHASQRFPEYSEAYDKVSAAIAAKEPANGQG